MTNFWLHVINVIHQEGSFRKASEKLFKARSAVSYSVKQVEQYYDIEIFSRETYRPELTRDGKILINKIQTLLDAANQFDVFARQINSEVEKELRISVSAIFPIEKVTCLLSHIKQSFPETIIHLDIETASGERMLRDDVVDIGIYAVPECNTAEFVYRCIERLKLSVYISSSFPLAKLDNLSHNELAPYPQVVVKSSYKSSPDSGIVKEALHWYVSDHHTKKSLIRSGLGWGRLTSHEAANEPKLIALNNLETLNIPIYVARKKDKALGPVASKVWEFFC
ncbi:LysR family transcriptional regulator [Vibrio ouci]|uniref:LysR family transcriptional regulator n=1 Tax=Vibrio ouci TaxID=2499078 RepID=A0A4Y8WJ75_9VIBR|nr:LysR family transcriptional regulator [Vibrio ouci]